MTVIMTRLRRLLAAFVVLLAVTANTNASSGAAWSGNMHPSLGFNSNPQCDAAGTRKNCAPTYATLAAHGALWPCPNATRASTPGACGTASNTACVPGQPADGNPLCSGKLSASKPCCCPKEGCYAVPSFNQIIGVCQGAGCACGGSSATAPSCGNGQCSSKCSGPQVACCFGNDVSALVPYYNAGSQVVLSYMATYQFDTAAGVWRILPNSSFNTDARFGAYDLMQPFGGLPEADAWLAPQPGGSAYWSLGYYAAGVPGAGHDGGVMFVLGTEQFWGATWYMLNSLTLDRGPAAAMPASMCAVTNDNCWASGNAGEMDFLEPSWSHGNASSTSQYRRSYSTQWNQIGRCFNGGVNGGGVGSQNYVVTSPERSLGPSEPIVYVAVVDSVGNWLYRIPASQVETVWPGLTRTTANETLRAAPVARPSSVNPCEGGYCYVFTSNCQATTWDEAHAQGCGFNGDQGFCGNWFAGFANTKQPLFPSETCQRDVRGGKTMPWCKYMVEQHSNGEARPAATGS